MLLRSWKKYQERDAFGFGITPVLSFITIWHLLNYEWVERPTTKWCICSTPVNRWTAASEMENEMYELKECMISCLMFYVSYCSLSFKSFILFYLQFHCCFLISFFAFLDLKVLLRFDLGFLSLWFWRYLLTCFLWFLHVNSFPNPPGRSSSYLIYKNCSWLQYSLKFLQMFVLVKMVVSTGWATAGLIHWCSEEMIFMLLISAVVRCLLLH